MDAVQWAHAALERADADVEYWMRQYKRSVEEVRAWAEGEGRDEGLEQPRYRLLQQTLQDTRYGLDYAVRGASDARQELMSARQFFLSVHKSEDAVETQLQPPDGPPAPVLTAPTDVGAVNFRIRTNDETLPSRPQLQLMVGESGRRGGVTSPASGAISVVRSGEAGDASLVETGHSTGVQVSSVKRGRELTYLVPPKRTKYPKTFEWPDKTKHHFPKDFTIPVCTLATMWTYWLCGDGNYPPFRILTAPELEEAKDKRSLSSLRFVMLEIESRILAKNVWINNPSPQEAAKMLEVVKDSIGVRPSAKRSELQPVEKLQWTSMGRILRDQKKAEGGDEGEA